MKQEYILILIIGMAILAYILDAIVNPLNIQLPTPYHFFTSDALVMYPFTTTSMIIKAAVLFITPLWLLSFMGISRLVKGAILLVIAGLMQLYALQDVVTKSNTLSLEWSLSLSLAGVILLIPSLIYIIVGFFKKFMGEENTFDSEKGENFWTEDHKP